MDLKSVIAEDMKNYMRQKDNIALEAIRMLRSDIKNAEIDSKKEFSDDDIAKLVQSTIKKNKDAAKIYEDAGRKDLMEKELRYCEVLSKYLPRQLSLEELEAVVRQVIADTGTEGGFGQVMKAVMSKVGSSSDGKSVSAVIKKVMG